MYYYYLQFRKTSANQLGNIEKGIESNQNLETDLEIRDSGWVNPRKTRALFKKFPGGGTNVAEPT